MGQHTGYTSKTLWKASNWARMGYAVDKPEVGAIVVWRNHVGKITGYDTKRNQWIVLSGNDSNRVRERPRSLKGAIAFRKLHKKYAEAIHD